MRDRLVFLPLGGCGEIGMNLTLYGFGPEGDERWIIADLGVTFGHEDTPGIDVICPDPAFIEERRRRLLGIVLTHGHEDHIGAVPYLWPRLKCPIYATPFTAHLVRQKLLDHGLLDEVRLHEIPLGGDLKLGPFDMRFIALTHSILEPNAIAIKTPLGTILHTGDWKFDDEPLIGPTSDEAALSALGNEGVLAMVCDSTNVFVDGHSGSEGSVRESLAALMAGKTGRIAVTAFASNVARIATIARVAASLGRHPVLVGRAMHRLIGAARAVGYLSDLPTIVAEEEAGFLPPETVCYICTGSQGEPRAALSRIIEGSHPHVTLEAGDTLIFSSRIIPGNERAIFALMNAFVEAGITVVSDARVHTHVSGHPCREELARMYRLARPQIAVPVHGESRHLAEHAELARSLQVPDAIAPRNGTLLRLAPGPPEVLDEIPSGRLYLDGSILIPAGDGTIAARRRLSFAGHVVVILVFDGKGRLESNPRITSYGLPAGEGDLHEQLEEEIEDGVLDAVEALSRPQARDDSAVEEAVRRAVRAALKTKWGKRPVVSVEIIRLET